MRGVAGDLSDMTEEIHEHDVAKIQVVRCDGAGMRGGDPAQLRVDGGRDEICSVRPWVRPVFDLRANRLNVRSVRVGIDGA